MFFRMRHSLLDISIFSSERFAWPRVSASAKRARNGRLKYAMSENPDLPCDVRDPARSAPGNANARCSRSSFTRSRNVFP
jgi:hypothetical protein